MPQILPKAPHEHALALAQDCITKTPVIILGSGASAGHGIPGMPQLRDHLANQPAFVGLDPEGMASWRAFQDELERVDLETALTAVRLPAEAQGHVTKLTWDLLGPADAAAFFNLVHDRGSLPLTRLFAHLFRSTHLVLDVVTPNYDRLAEFAADAGEFSHYTGFGYGHLRFRDKDGALKLSRNRQPVRTVRIWKVHGSLDWFKNRDGVVVGLPAFGSRPPGLEPAIVTPGVEKYRMTHDEPFRSIFQGADAALQSARSYLCIGYGFNDEHIQTKLVERCESQDVPLVLITKEITTSAREFLSSGKCRSYLALEDSPGGYRMYSNHYPLGVEVDGKPIWQLAEFLSMVI